VAVSAELRSWCGPQVASVLVEPATSGAADLGSREPATSPPPPCLPDEEQDWMFDDAPQTDWRPLSQVPVAHELMDRARQLQTASRARATRVSYRHWWQVFGEFCAQVRWAVSAASVPLPVHPDVVVMWVAWLSARYAESTIAISLAAIAAVHTGHGLQSPAGGARIRSMLSGVARTGRVRGVSEPVVVLPAHLKAFVRLEGVVSADDKPWSVLRVLRAKAMVVLGFMAYLRKSEVDGLDRCDVTRESNCTKVRVCRAKNDPVGRGRVTVVGSACGDSRMMEQTLWTWVDAAGLRVSSACSKAQDPRARCVACGPLFPRLGGHGSVSRSPIGKGTLTAELRSLYAQCQKVGSLPLSIDVKKLSAISLRRGGNSAAVAAGVSSQIRAAHGRWKAVETPDQSYTFVHQAEMVALATTMLQPRM
jgi:hypothetical protein